ncbi:helix-turn-helix transcriptional regulator [Faecalibacterium sp. OM04-11BH]|jgi:transcriptional regulator with XRE-family HTH domain|uniref:helix-turn-helix domain-containing protein n=1 Tax=Faecalibacterium sp. OM04-11BH TaxID=2292357 RepID=UPI000E4FD1D7|nr:helix-turn-helix transcriptional regulator [Faecalibacterium sp. OM04-11BH]RHV53811.1 XRE family transcriptional regulator [Faecalibacterium sp. OM04-11BH]
MTIGELIRDARKKKGLTQKELGERLEVSDVSIAQWENGIRNPRFETRQKLAKALDIDIVELMSETEKQDYFDLFGTDAERVGFALVKLKERMEVKVRELREYGGIATPARRRAWALELAKELAENYHVKEESILKEIGLDDLPEESIAEISLADDYQEVGENQIADSIVHLLMSMNSTGCKAALRHIQELSKIPDYKKV